MTLEDSCGILHVSCGVSMELSLEWLSDWCAMLISVLIGQPAKFTAGSQEGVGARFGIMEQHAFDFN